VSLPIHVSSCIHLNLTSTFDILTYNLFFVKHQLNNLNTQLQNFNIGRTFINP
jgi:hypothetical protein